jgi:hypothetical protein
VHLLIYVFIQYALKCNGIIMIIRDPLMV